MNTDADTLSRYPVNFQNDMKEHTKTMSPELGSAVWQGSKAVQESDVAWVAALQWLLQHNRRIQPSRKLSL